MKKHGGGVQMQLHLFTWLLDEREWVHAPAACLLERGPEEPTGKKVGLETVTKREICALTGDWNMILQPIASSLSWQLSPFLILNYKMSIDNAFRRKSEYKNISKLITNSTTRVRFKIKHLCWIQNEVFLRHEISFLVFLEHPTLLHWDTAYINMSSEIWSCHSGD
jgi:hypothetical protein